jgi:serine/threonine protein kinase
MEQLYDNKYRYIKDLGKGGFGKVFLAKEERSETALVAIKQLKERRQRINRMILFTKCKWYHSSTIPNIVII